MFKRALDSVVRRERLLAPFWVERFNPLPLRFLFPLLFCLGYVSAYKADFVEGI